MHASWAPLASTYCVLLTPPPFTSGCGLTMLLSLLVGRLPPSCACTGWVVVVSRRRRTTSSPQDW